MSTSLSLLSKPQPSDAVLVRRHINRQLAVFPIPHTHTGAPDKTPSFAVNKLDLDGLCAKSRGAQREKEGR